MAVAEELGVDHEVVQYLKTPPDRATLEAIVAKLEDPVEDLVRKDAKFKELGLDPDDYVGDPRAVVELLLERPALMQRPLVVTDDRAAIGRPKDRVAELLTGP